MIIQGTRRAFSAGLAILLLLPPPGLAWASGKKPPQAPPAPQGRLVVALAPTDNVRIEMPDGSFHNFGVDFMDLLTGRLTNNTTGRLFQIVTATQSKGAGLRASKLLDDEIPRYEWDGSYVPAAVVRVSVDALSFTTGDRGDRMFYGFDERFRTPFNNGVTNEANDFPLRTQTVQPNWFESSFDEKSSAISIINSHTGLDLGQGFNINLIYAWLDVKYAFYESRLNLTVEIDENFTGRRLAKKIQVKGKGYYFDIAGAYQGYSGGIAIARRDAMSRAFQNAMEGTQDAVIRAVQDLALTGKIDGVQDGLVLLGTGFDSQIPIGTRYSVVEAPETVIEVVQTSSSGSIGKVVQGELAAASPGRFIRELKAGEAPIASANALMQGKAMAGSDRELVSSEDVTLADQNFDPADLQGQGPENDWGVAAAKLLFEIPLLIYRIARYFDYDQAYNKSAGGTPAEWSTRLREEESWARTIGLSAVALVPEHQEAPVVAVLDSGVDYNHPAIHDSLWLNPNPTTDTRGYQDRYGWDFISGDSRPFDDAYHGSWIASSVLAVAPHARIMAVKAFNPWGITSSAAIYGGFQYAVDHGAQIIVCGWSTRKHSAAIEKGVAYARERGVLVVAAAGDRGDDLNQVASYPAVLSKTYDNVLTVTSVDEQDQLVRVSGRYSNVGARYVGIAAPGERVLVAEPRDRQDRDTSSGISAALVAGAAARLVSEFAAGAETPARAPAAVIDRLKAEADVVPGLEQAVDGARRLRIRH